MTEPKNKVQVQIENSVACIGIGRINIINLTRRSSEDLIYDELPGECHPEVDLLKKKISIEDLIVAIRKKALGSKDGHVVRQYVWLDGAVGTLISSYLLIWFMVFAYLMISHQATLVQQIQLLSGLAVTSIFLIYVAETYIRPQRVAKRAMGVLASAHSSINPCPVTNQWRDK